jgi:hypothetical protein
MTRLILTAMLTIAVFCGESVSRADFIDFNTPGDFTGNFMQNPADTSHYAETNSIGVGGSRALDVLMYGPNDGGVATAAYKSASYDLSSVGSRLSLSLFVRAGNYNTALTTLQLAIMGDSSQNLTDADATAQFLSISFNRFYSRLEVTNKTSDSPATTSSFTTGGTVATGKWYKLSLDLTNAGSDSFSLSAALDDYGATGVASPVRVITLSPTLFSNPALASDGTLYAGFQGHSAGGADVYDNFSVQAPEPSVLTLLVIGAASLFAYAWRRQAS